MTTEKANPTTTAAATVQRGAGMDEQAHATGRYHVECRGPRAEDLDVYLARMAKADSLRHMKDPASKRKMRAFRREAFDLTVVKWSEPIQNLVTTVGKNFALDTVFAGSTYTAVWYMGLISSTSYSAVAAADTMASHAGWLEAGVANAPTYSQGTRPAPAFSSASAGSKATSSAVAFSITSTGTVKGCFLNSVSTKDGTTGTLYSAGLFSGGDKVVGNGDTLSVTYTASL